MFSRTVRAVSNSARRLETLAPKARVSPTASLVAAPAVAPVSLSRTLTTGTNASVVYAQPVRMMKMTRVLRDWHEKRDPKTGEFYYYNIFTEEITKTRPREYLAWDTPKESPMMRFLRTDTLKERSGRMPSAQYFMMVVTIFAALMVWDHFHPAGEDPEAKRLRDLSPEDKAIQEEKARRLAQLKEGLKNAKA